MSEREMVRVSLFSDSFYGYSDLRKTLPQAIAWLQGLLAQVPPEHRDGSVFEIETEKDYEGGYDTSLRIYFDRPITDAELAQREAEDEADRRRQHAEAEARERATYEALKAKFG